MTEVSNPPRSEVPTKYTWNAPSVFATPEDWLAELQNISGCLELPAKYKGRLGESPVLLVEALELVEDLLNRSGKLLMYADMSHEVDTTDQAAAGWMGQAASLMGQVRGAVAYLEPELLAIGRETLEGWMKTEPGLAKYRHRVDNLFRKQAHVRSAEVEEIMGMLADPFSSAARTAGVLINADFRHPPAANTDGSELPVAEGTIDKILASADRKARKTAWENYSDTYLEHKNTLANNLATSIKQNVFEARVRKHQNSLEMALFHENVPVEVFYNLINVFHKNLPTWHRYWAIRRKALKVDELNTYDIWAPLAGDQPPISYEQSVEMICKGLEPMGAEYVEIMRQGCLRDRWVDVYPNQGKTSGAFSGGWPGSFPFILMSYDDTIFSTSTLAHELGHSMHSYLTWHAQPFVYTQPPEFVSEVASNFHQAMVRAYLLKSSGDRSFQISVIEEAMSNFHRYFFIMPTLARFELETHQRIERGQALTASDMIELMADLFSEAYGGEVVVDRPRVGITWATFVHLYMDYYVFQYATGISGAHALSTRILTGQPGAVEDYLGFLKAGSSGYPLDILRAAGVDLASPQPVEETFQTLAGMVDQLEKLVASDQ